MQFAVWKYGTDFDYRERIAVFDTGDCSVQEVSVSELKEFGVDVKNIEYIEENGVYLARAVKEGMFDMFYDETYHSPRFNCALSTGAIRIMDEVPTEFLIEKSRYSSERACLRICGKKLKAKVIGFLCTYLYLSLI